MPFPIDYPSYPSRIIVWMFLLLTIALALPAWSGQTDIPGPAGTGTFGNKITLLPNGNFVVTDSAYSIPAGAANVGAVYLYGSTGTLISTLTGSTVNDQVGSSGVTVLTNGNYVVNSSQWNNGAATQAGAVTWGSGTTGINGPVSATNSLVGSTTNDQVGRNGVTALSNGNYVVRSSIWTNAAVTNAGAVTWGNGTTGISGPVSAANSLVGSTANDNVGNFGVTALGNGNYTVISNSWHNGAVAFAGAVTWGNGTAGISGPVSSANSLVGTTANDGVGTNGVTALSNGNYVVKTTAWNNGAATQAGAVTWGSGTTGVSGPVSAANSLVGTTANDSVGTNGVAALSNGNYVVRSSQWHNGAVAFAGAATWGNGTTGISGPVSAANSLVGTAADQVGIGLTALSNGNYVVNTPGWHNGAVTNAGAATWGDGTTGISGPVSAANSLVGSTAGDQVGGNVTALTNGNYVVSSTNWNNGAITQAGASTWGNGTTGISGAVSAANSLVGSTANDQVGGGVTVLTNGNYVVSSVFWHNGGAAGAGAATWGNGITGISGAVSAVNSLVGSTANDNVGNGGSVIALTNGNYVVNTGSWHNGASASAGAVTWGNGTTGISGPVSSVNSLVGSTAFDDIGGGGVTALTNGNYVVNSPQWHNGVVANAGAATWGSGAAGVSGPVAAANSLVGSTASDAIGNGTVTALTNGNYVVCSPGWHNGALAFAGAVTWVDGSIGITGLVTAANSLIGSVAGDAVGNSPATALTNGNYVAVSTQWHNGAVVGAGAVSLGNGSTGTTGAVTANNSVEGTVASGGVNLIFVYDPGHLRLVVGRPDSNIVTLFPGVASAPAAKLAFTTQPGNGTPGAAFTSQPVVALQDAGGNTVTGTAQSVTLAIQNNAGPGGTLNGTSIAAVNPVTGLATFSGLSIDKIGNGYTLTATGNTVSTTAGVVVSGAFNIVGAGVVFTSAPTATPAVAGTGQTVAFNAAASEAGGTITYSWTFSDGTTATGSSPTHAFNVAGTFTATVTAADQTNSAVSASVTVTVNAPIVGTGLDSDGDGFSDSFESFWGSNPFDPSSTPFGGLPAGAAQELTVSKLSIKLNFAKSGADSVMLSGTLPIPAGFKVSGSKFGLFLSGISKKIVLDAKGHSPKGHDSLIIQIKSGKGAVVAQTAKFTLKLNKGQFATELADAGLANTTVKNQSVTIPVTVIFNNTVFQANVAQKYTATKGKTGATK